MMIPRGSPDLAWKDLWFGFGACLPGRHAAVSAQIAGAHDLIATSVRSGFDLLLQALALPPGSEIIVSAITIPDMMSIIEHHQLKPVAVDIDAATLAPPAEAVAQAITERTRAVLVAQLFGCRADLSALGALCRAHGLLLLEDCAQAFDGSYAGHQAADAALFSFGPIKTATALGGAVLSVRNPAVRARMAELQARYPRQALQTHLQRLALFAGLKLLALPLLFGWFVAGCRMAGANYDALLSRMLRSSRAGSLEQRLRRRPHPALLALLARRLRQDHRRRIAQRSALARRIIAGLPPGSVPGAAAPEHSHWVLPVCAADPDTLVRRLRAAGFDASRTASSMTVVAAPGTAPAAERLMATIVYVPLHRALLALQPGWLDAMQH